MAEVNSYEEKRRRQVEENKRKIEELRLHHLSAAVREATAKPKPIKSQKRKARPSDAPPRRSGRIASLPEQPNYRDTNTKDVKQSDLPDHVYAITKAEELQDELGSDYPSFVRPMTLSLLRIPMQFSREHLPEHSAMVSLVDEEDDEFDVRYHPHRSCFTAGWREFAMYHELVDGDCLVFELVRRAMFKVYIIRASSYYDDDH